MAIAGSEAEKWIQELLTANKVDINVREVRRVVIDIPTDGVVALYVEQYGDKATFEVGVRSGLRVVRASEQPIAISEPINLEDVCRWYDVTPVQVLGLAQEMAERLHGKQPISPGENPPESVERRSEPTRRLPKVDEGYRGLVD